MRLDSDTLRALTVARRFREDVAPFRGAMAVALVLQLVAMGFELVRPWALQQIVDRALIGREPGAARIVWIGAGVLALVVIARIAVEYVATLRIVATGHAVTRALRLRAFRHMVELPPAFHTGQKPGDLLMRLMGDAPMVSTMLVESRVHLVARALQVIATVGLMLAVDARLTLTLALFLPAVALLARFLAGRLTIATRKQRRKEGEMADMMQEALTATPVIQSLGHEQEAVRAFAKSNRRSARAGVKTAKAAQRLSSSVEALLAVALGLTVALGGTRVLEPGSGFTAGMLLVFLSYVRGVMKPLRSASKHQARIAKGVACAERLTRVLDEDRAVRTTAGSELPPLRPTSLRFDGVGYGYGDGRPALRDVDLELHAGEVTALEGDSGAGKSTLAALALRLMDPGRGEVMLDGIPLPRFDLDALRERLALSMQATVLFGATVRDNLLLGRTEDGVDDGEIWRALERAAAADFVRELPGGLDYTLGAGGSRLSGGQRRRLCLARAFLRDAPILVVDEPFAGLDAAAADRVEESLVAFAREGRMVVVIAHEEERTLRLDRRVVIAGGRVVSDRRGGVRRDPAVEVAP